MHKHLLLVFASACVMGHRLPPAAPFQYGPELHEIADAIDDLKDAHEVSPGTTTAIASLEAAFKLACGTWHVSCERQTWLPTFASKGDSGTSMAHALGDIDRAYSAFWAERVDLVTTQLEDARRGVRELLVRRERLGVDGRLPEERQMIFTREDLQYVRMLIAGEMPPADAAWNYEKGIAELDAAIAMIDGSDLDPDRARVAIILPNPGDFAALPYRDRMNVAYDVLHRIADDLTHDRKLERKTREQLAAHLMNVRSALGRAKNAGTVRS
jgi:hypothetical protein